ncbi:MAG: type VI secretion system protein ImpE [Myxococcota bacterium]|jgi:type VI secretion system protein ImpE
MTRTPESLLDEDDLTGALAAAEARAESAPDDTGNHFLLFELRVLFEDFDGAARALAALPPSFDEARRELGGLLSAEKRRRDVLLRGLVAPSFLMAPPPHIRPHFDALVGLINGTLDDSERQMGRLAVPPLPGLIDGEPFKGLRDCDDLLAPVLEFLVPGAYGWLPLTQLRSISLLPAKGYTDVIWIPAQITLRDQDGEHFVRIPSLYVGTGSRSDPERLGRETRWERPLAGISRAFGQRDLIVEAHDNSRKTLGIRDIHEILFSDFAAS